jgi:uncharacterized protein YcfL
MKPLALVIAILASTCLLQVGCQGPNTSSNQLEGNATADQRIINDPAFAGSLEVIGKKVMRTDDGFLIVQITAHNLGKSTCDFESMYEWFDAKGMKISNNMETWRPGSVYGLAVKEVKGIAPTMNAESFRFHIRRPNPIISTEREQ